MRVKLALKTLCTLGLALILNACCSGSCKNVKKDPNDTREPLECPWTDKNETVLDCPWAGVARLLRQTASKDQKAIVTQQVPELADQIEKDLKNNAVIEKSWGHSLNFDENAQRAIIDEDIIVLLSQWLNIKDPDGDQVHAGVAHTYGYIFSLLHTPYGYKRARWIEGEIEKGLGLPEKIFHPKTKEGSFLSNVTYFAGRVGLRDSADAQIEIKKLEPSVSPALIELHYELLKTRRLREVLPEVEIRTDFVAFKDKSIKDQYLLIYSYKLKDEDPKLITLFPVKTGFYEKTLATQLLGENQEISDHYNAFIPHVTGEKEKRKGNRRVEIK